jgi:hypothetical protein
MQHMNIERLARKLLGHKRGRRTLSRAQQEAERKRGKALARFHPERQGKIGRIESQIHIAIRLAGRPLSTRELVDAVYLNSHLDQNGRWRGGSAQPPQLEHWMFGNVRRSAETYCYRAGRNKGGVLWALKGDGLARTIRAQKREAYAAQRRKRQRQAAKVSEKRVAELEAEIARLRGKIDNTE